MYKRKCFRLIAKKYNFLKTKSEEVKSCPEFYQSYYGARPSYYGARPSYYGAIKAITENSFVIWLKKLVTLCCDQNVQEADTNWLSSIQLRKSNFKPYIFNLKTIAGRSQVLIILFREYCCFLKCGFCEHVTGKLIRLGKSSKIY